ncbi:MAG TPA: TRAP transporter small permease, partial [Acetobacteraceae bacterium]|nr:TRAP transporter small permease [Acetobacteraceae bacterium]
MSVEVPGLHGEIADASAIAPGWPALRRTARALDDAIGTVCEVAGAMLVLAEVTILFAGVVSRYVFDSPIFWTDELANFLFLWLAMLGVVIALRKDAHMRLTTLVAWAPPLWGRRFSAVAALVVIAFVLEILLPATQYFSQQRFVTLISLGISDGYRVAAILVGMTLSALIALMRLLETTTPKTFTLGVAVVGGIAAGLWLAQP